MRIKSITTINDDVDYVDITVEGTHNFVLQDGAVVHNCGTGAGFSVERQFISELPKLNTPLSRKIYDPDMFPGVNPAELSVFGKKTNTIRIHDSKYGWASALRILIVELYNGNYGVKWDMSAVRPAGSRLKVFGGRASGSGPLDDLFTFVKNVFINATGPRLTSIECHDIVCKIASIVIAGGVRRSALISLSNLSDERMRHAKSGAWWEHNGQRALANNSVAYTEKPDIGIFMSEWKALYDSKSGERGLFNREAAKKSCAAIGRDPNHEFLTNPCLTGDTLVAIPERGLVRISGLAGSTQNVLTQNGDIVPARFENTADNAVIWEVALSNGALIHATEYHNFVMEDGTKRRLKDLGVGDRLMRSMFRNVFGKLHDVSLAKRDGQHGSDANVPEWLFQADEESIATYLDAVITYSEALIVWSDQHLSLRLANGSISFYHGLANLLTMCGIGTHVHTISTQNNSLYIPVIDIDNPVALFAALQAGMLPEIIGAQKYLSVDYVVQLPRTEPVYCAGEPTTNSFALAHIVSGNCAEIILRPSSVCNLSEVVVRSHDTLKTLKDKVEIATILGTLQSTLTNFVYLPPEWKQNCEEERLLGVSLTGIMDHSVLAGGDIESRRVCSDWLRSMRDLARTVNAEWADALGINPAKSITCVKPSGTVSSLVDSASGIHPRYAQHYLRRVRSDVKDPLTQVMIQQGFPHEVDVMNPSNIVFAFPMKAPKNAVLRSDRTAVQQLEHWLMIKQNWCEHTASISVYVREHEWLEAAAWVYEHFDDITGVSFFPYSDHSYQQAPYEEITAEDYERLVKEIPTGVDLLALAAIETGDNSVFQHDLSCSGGACEL
ncbi:hypothetical protein [Chromatium okenii]|jgi:hypothetical protein|uniref:hypothetical protein n=1 Tax=Chromatium okenii TaxID=61644 RepID=UPI0026F16C4A|nr:hypothetical protein [Chromatium okenii]MBV5310898.1 hypothetical protein [Chromatium okenii]